MSQLWIKDIIWASDAASNQFPRGQLSASSIHWWNQVTDETITEFLNADSVGLSGVFIYVLSDITLFRMWIFRVSGSYEPILIQKKDVQARVFPNVLFIFVSWLI